MITLGPVIELDAKPSLLQERERREREAKAAREKQWRQCELSRDMRDRHSINPMADVFARVNRATLL